MNERTIDSEIPASWTTHLRPQWTDIPIFVGLMCAAVYGFRWGLRGIFGTAIYFLVARIVLKQGVEAYTCAAQLAARGIHRAWTKRRKREVLHRG